MFDQTRNAIALERDLAPNSLSYLQRRRLEGAQVTTSRGAPPREAIQIRITGPEMLRRNSPHQLLDHLIGQGYRWYVVDDMTGPVADGSFEELLMSRFELIHRIEPGDPEVQAPMFNFTNQFDRSTLFDVFRVRHLGPRVDIYRLR
jgi:hypothetical protein